jgi:hypothetical protein
MQLKLLEVTPYNATNKNHRKNKTKPACSNTRLEESSLIDLDMMTIIYNFHFFYFFANSFDSSS